MINQAIVEVVSSGYKAYGEDGEAGVSWWFCPRMTQEQILDFLDHHGIYSYYGGPGRGFANKPCIRHTKYHTLITQSSGLDI